MDWEDGGNGFDLQYKFVCDDDTRLEGVADWSALIYDRNCDLPREGNAPSPSSWHRHCSYTDSNRLGPVWRRTSIPARSPARSMITARSISLSPWPPCSPRFLHAEILLACAPHCPRGWSAGLMPIPPRQEATAVMLQGLAGALPIETHISLVFVGADTVWKLKKAIELPFLDFTNAEDRRRFTERELALNATAAPGLYRDMLAVVRQEMGPWCFRTRQRMPRRWTGCCAWRACRPKTFSMPSPRRGGLTLALQDALADAVAAYPSCAAGSDGGAAADAADRARQRSLGAWRRPARARCARLAGRGPCRAGRARTIAHAARADGFVRRAHGDLHLGNLCLWQGRPVPFDALEFDEALATIDLGYDLAFLLMDLDQRVTGRLRIAC